MPSANVNAILFIFFSQVCYTKKYLVSTYICVTSVFFGIVTVIAVVSNGIMHTEGNVLRKELSWS